MPILINQTIYVIEASIRGASQWSVFTLNTEGATYIAKTISQIRKNLTRLRQDQTYELLEFRIKPYQPVEDQSNVN